VTAEGAAVTVQQPARRARGGFTFLHAAFVGVLVWAMALACAIFFARGDWRPGLVTGAVAGGAGGLAGLVMLGGVLDKTATAALAARSIAFLVRLMLIALGLVVTVRVYKGEPMAFVFSFFPLFFVFTGLEQLVSIWGTATVAPAPERRPQGEN
jgi:hypothetical protein